MQNFFQLIIEQISVFNFRPRGSLENSKPTQFSCGSPTFFPSHNIILILYYFRKNKRLARSGIILVNTNKRSRMFFWSKAYNCFFSWKTELKLIIYAGTSKWRLLEKLNLFFFMQQTKNVIFGNQLFYFSSCYWATLI